MKAVENTRTAYAESPVFDIMMKMLPRKFLDEVRRVAPTLPDKATHILHFAFLSVNHQLRQGRKEKEDGGSV
jgi:hypothetical protein